MKFLEAKNRDKLLRSYFAFAPNGEPDLDYPLGCVEQGVARYNLDIILQTYNKSIEEKNEFVTNQIKKLAVQFNFTEKLKNMEDSMEKDKNVPEDFTKLGESGLLFAENKFYISEKLEGAEEETFKEVNFILNDGEVDIQEKFLSYLKDSIEELTTLKNTISEKDTLIENMSNEKEAYVLEKENFIAEIEEYKNKEQNLSAESQTKEEELNTLKNTIQEKDNRISELETLNADYSNKVEETENKLFSTLFDFELSKSELSDEGKQVIKDYVETNSVKDIEQIKKEIAYIEKEYGKTKEEFKTYVPETVKSEALDAFSKLEKNLEKK